MRFALPVLALAAALAALLPASPSGAQSPATASREVAENQPAGTAVGAPVTLAAPTGAVTHTLGGADAATFSIVAASGQLRTNGPLDHEARDSYQVTVTAQDDNGSTQIAVTISVTDVEEPGAVTVSPTAPRVGTVIRARLSDPDGGVDPGNIFWRWSVSADGLQFSLVAGGVGAGAAYTPASADAGKYLKVSAGYADARGRDGGPYGKTAEWVSGAVIGALMEPPALTVRTILSGLTIPWDLAFTPDGAMLITERGGKLRSRLPDGRVRVVSADFSDLFARGEAGLMSIAVDPSFASNRRFYTCQAHSGPEVQVIAWTIDAAYGAAVRAADPLVGGIPLSASSGRHGGCRLGFGADGYLYITTGDAELASVPQDLASLGGKVLRVDASSGAAAPGNPFNTRVYSYGHRNPQGLAFRPGGAQVWVVEHGPTWDDEINLLVAGGNYGWAPGAGYNQRVPMTDLRAFPGAIEASWSSGFPAIATSGAVFLDGAGWGAWNGRLAVASLKNSSLRVFEFDSAGALLSEILVAELDRTHGRLRSPVLGPDGALYLTTSNGNGRDRILQVFGPATPRLSGSQAVSYGEQGTVDVASYSAHHLGSSPSWSVAGQDAAAFEIAGGALRFRTPPAFAAPADADLDNVYHVAVEASDGTDTARIAVAVTVTAGKLNTPPAFADPSTTRSVAESAAIGAAVGARVAAADPDSGDTLTYRIVEEQVLFTVDAGTGQLRVAAALDHETAASHALTLEVSDGVDAGGNPDPAIDDSSSVTITVTDVDEPPAISGTAAYTVAEGSATALGAYSASDPEGDDVSWLALAGPEAGYFAFDADTGALAFAATPDREARTSALYRVTVRASDEGGRSGGLAVTVTLTDVPEPPAVTGPSDVTVDEIVNPSPNQVVTVGAYRKRDPDRPPQATNWGAVGGVVVLSGADSGAFAFDRQSGRLSFASPPDYEAGGGRYDVTLTANDGALEGALDVTVRVANVDEPGALRFDRRTPVISRAITATRTDPDGVVSATWQWQRSTSRSGGWTDIANADAGSYTPVADDRGYYLRATVGYEDGHGPDKSAGAVTEFAVANDRAANTAPAFPDTVADIAIPENSRPGRNVGGPVRASDAERDPLTYSLSGADEFVINARTGQIQVARGAGFDFEDQASYALTVSADDGFGGTGSVAVTVTITDVNEAPVAVDDAPGSFDEDTAATIDVLANDSDPEDDASDLRISIQRRPTRGAVTVNAPQDPGDRPTVTYTPRADYSGSDSFSYRARDSGNLHSNVATVALTISPVNDDPAFPAATAARRVSRTAGEGDGVGAPVTATDVDGDDLTYSLAGADAFEFGIDGASGQITVGPGTTFDIAARNTYAVTVHADDGNGGQASIAVTITVTAGRVATPVFIGGGGGGGGGGPGGPTPSTADFEWTVTRDLEQLDPGHDTPSGMWSDGSLLFLAENGAGADDAVYAYDLAGGERVEEREFALAQTNRAPRGLWSNGETVWVSDSGRERLFAYDLATGERDEQRELALAPRNADARGIWSDGATIWVLDGVRDGLFAYDLATGGLLGEYRLAARNTDPRGLWSDGVTIWVSDHGLKQLWAYRLPVPPGAPGEDADPIPLERHGGEDFTLLSRSSNNSPRGIWSDGEHMYVADENDDKVYSYNIPDAIDARLATLTLSGVAFGDFDPATTGYEGVAGEGVTETTVEAAATQPGAEVVIHPPDADAGADGHQLVLDGDTELAITVTSADGARTRIYRVRLDDPRWDPASDPWPHCLRGAVAAGFSLVAYEGGGIEELAACAERRHVVALYVLHEGVYLPYIPGAPAFVNREFGELFAAGLPPLTPLIAASDGPPTADPFGDFPGDEAVLQPWPECLRGPVSEGFSLVVYAGGSVEALAACAQGLDLTALYALNDGAWLSYVPGAPAFVNGEFRELFADGVPGLTPLVVKSERAAGSGLDGAGAEGN